MKSRSKPTLRSKSIIQFAFSIGLGWPAPLEAQSKLDARLRALALEVAAPAQAFPLAAAPRMVEFLTLHGVIDLRTEGSGRNQVRALLRTRLTDARLAALGIVLTSRAGDIISAWVPAQALSALAVDPAVDYVQASTAIASASSARLAGLVIDQATTDSRAAQVRRLIGISGKGVVIGIVDSGIDFAHQDFIKPDGTTRIRALWDMSDFGGPAPEGFPNSGGTFWSESEINAALAGNGVVRQLDRDGHGSHVAGIAAGNGRQADGTIAPGTYVGVAPDADLVIVKATRSQSAGGGFQTADMIDAVRFIDQTAASLGAPWVANLSLGTIVGPFDGTNLEEIALDELVGASKPGKAIVIAAGNSAGVRIHSELNLGPSLTRRIGVGAYVPFATPASNAFLVECWHPPSAATAVSVITPAGQTVGPIVSGSYSEGGPQFAVGTPSGGVYVDNAAAGPDPRNGDHVLSIVVFGYATSQSRVDVGTGTWQLQVTGGEGSMHCRVRRSIPAEFAAGDGDDLFTLAMPGSAHNAITVGSYTTRTAWTDINGVLRSTTRTIGNIAPYSSVGPTRDGRIKPEIAGPGDMVIAPLSAASAAGFDAMFRVGQNHLAITGTSMATPHVSGIAALLFEHDALLDAAQLRQRLMESARADAFTQVVPNPRWGAGKADVLEVLRSGMLIGDVNGDLRVDIGDPITLVNGILGRTELTLAQKLIAELNIDGELNVADVVGIANQVLTAAAAPSIADRTTVTAHSRVAIGPAVTSAAIVSLPVRLSAPVPLAGIELDIEYGASGLRLGAPILDERATFLRMLYDDDGARIRVVAWGSSAATIPAGDAIVLRVPVLESTTRASATSPVRLTRVRLADREGRLLEAGTAPVLAVRRFTVHANRPNPLSSRTGTRFDVEIADSDGSLPGLSSGAALNVTAGAGHAGPGSVRVSVNVYNVRGQLVRRVFDGALPPGRFTVEWDGRGESGSQLVPGLYYCDVVGAGTRERLRMIVVAS